MNSLPKLSPRQHEILFYVTKGLTNKEIAKLLGLSSNTIKTHLAAALKTLQASNRTEAASLYLALSGFDGNRMLRLYAVAEEPQVMGEKSAIEFAIGRFNLFRLYQTNESSPDYSLAVAKAGDYVQLRLHHCASGELVWQQQYKAASFYHVSLADVAALEVCQQVIAHCVAQQKPVAGEQGYLHFYHGISYIIQNLPESPSLCFAHMQEAVAQIPDHGAVLAFAGLNEYQNLVEGTGVREAEDTVKTVFELSQRALFLDKDCSWVHLLNAINLLLQGKLDLTLMHLDTAANNNPANHMVMRFRAQMHALAENHSQALADIDCALELYPAQQWQGLMATAKALVFYALQDYDACIDHCSRSNDFIDGSLLNQLVWLACLVFTDRVDEAEPIVAGLPEFDQQDYQRLLLMLPGAAIERFSQALKQLGVLQE